MIIYDKRKKFTHTT